MLIEPLESLGMLRGQREKVKDQPFRREKLMAFSLTPFGRMLLNTLPY
jgi:hypothetical protein